MEENKVKNTSKPKSPFFYPLLIVCLISLFMSFYLGRGIFGFVGNLFIACIFSGLSALLPNMRNVGSAMKVSFWVMLVLVILSVSTVLMRQQL